MAIVGNHCPPGWLARCHRVRQFEDLLIETGTNILKFYLHISKQERLARFTARLEDPARSWKINESNYYERVYRDDYVAAFEDAMLATSTKDSPWFIMPANHNWFRNLAVSQIIADTMEGPHMSYPKRTIDLAEIRREYHAAEREAQDARQAAAEERQGNDVAAAS